MAFNTDLADRLDELAELLELTGANRFRVIAHQKAGRVVREHTTDLAPIAEDEASLTEIDGIGKGMAEKIAQFAATGRIAELEDLRAKVPPGVPALLRLEGLGPKTVAALWNEAGVTSLDELKRALDDGRAAGLAGMGEKKLANIRAAISLAETAGRRLHLGAAMPLARQIVARVLDVPGVRRAEPAGSLRRGRETVGDIDILCVCDDAAGASAAFCAMPEVLRVLTSGERKSSVVVSLDKFGLTDERWAFGAEGGVQVDLRIVPEESFGAALMYFTGSKEHNVRLRERAQKMGMTLNEYGLFPEDGRPTPPQARGVRPEAARTEEEVFGALGVVYLPPTVREDRGELALPATPRLVEVGDVKAELHSHTTASDGRLSIEQSAAIARARGFHTLAITDHSQSSAVANGLKPERLREHIRAVRDADARLNASAQTAIRVLPGSEVDILVDGALDYDDDLLAELDVIVASPHAALKQDAKKATKRLIRAVEHPLVHILGHPTGRLVDRRPGLEPDMGELLAAARENDVALEINAHWMRLDLRDTHVRAAVEAGCLIAIDCDVHFAEDYDNLIYGVLTGQRGWLPPERCINCWPAGTLHAWLRKKHERAGVASGHSRRA
jgi:DNA polymerase (family 10)